METAWTYFQEKLKAFPDLLKDLNPGCTKADLEKIEKKMGLMFPGDIKSLYLLHNGQKGKKGGIFKAVSGYSKFSKPFFLPLGEMHLMWQQLKSIEGLFDFKETDIPFAADKYVHQQNTPGIDDVFCINAEDDKVYLLWIGVGDPFLPYDWQTNRIEEAANLAEFLKKQAGLY